MGVDLDQQNVALEAGDIVDLGYDSSGEVDPGGSQARDLSRARLGGAIRKLAVVLVVPQANAAGRPKIEMGPVECVDLLGKAGSVTPMDQSED